MCFCKDVEKETAGLRPAIVMMLYHIFCIMPF